MYAEHFGFRELPFNNTPDPRFFYSTPDHEEALASLAYTVQQRKGFVLLTGEVGTGKTLISRLMLRQFGSQIAFAHVNHAVPSAADLLESICAELEIGVEPGSTVARVVRRLHDFLLARFAQDVPVVLVLDEAQNLPDEAFELIRTIGNLEADDAKLLQIVIVGQPELQERFASPQLRQLRQRVFRSFHLTALNRSATEAYIRFRIEVAGGGRQPIFDREAVDRIYEYSQGLPRLINTLCDNALLSAYSADRKSIDGRFLQGVVDQLMMSASCATRAGKSGSRVTQAAVAAVIEPTAVGTTGNHAKGEGKATFEKLSRIVDVLESRVAASQRTDDRPTADVSPEWESSVRRSQESAERLLVEIEDRERKSAQVAVQLADVLAQVRTSYEGVRTLCGAAGSLKKEMTALYDRIGERMDQFRHLVVEAKTLAADHRTGGAAMASSPSISRTMTARSASRSSFGAGSALGKSAALEVSRGVAQLLTLVDDRKRQSSQGLGQAPMDRENAFGTTGANAARLTREVNQLLAEAG